MVGVRGEEVGVRRGGGGERGGRERDGGSEGGGRRSKGSREEGRREAGLHQLLLRGRGEVRKQGKERLKKQKQYRINVKANKLIN